MILTRAFSPTSCTDHMFTPNASARMSGNATGVQTLPLLPGAGIRRQNSPRAQRAEQAAPSDASDSKVARLSNSPGLGRHGTDSTRALLSPTLASSTSWDAFSSIKWNFCKVTIVLAPLITIIFSASAWRGTNYVNKLSPRSYEMVMWTMCADHDVSRLVAMAP